MASGSHAHGITQSAHFGRHIYLDSFAGNNICG